MVLQISTIPRLNRVNYPHFIAQPGNLAPLPEIHSTGRPPPMRYFRTGRMLCRAGQKPRFRMGHRCKLRGFDSDRRQRHHAPHQNTPVRMLREKSVPKAPSPIWAIATFTIGRAEVLKLWPADPGTEADPAIWQHRTPSI